MRKLQEMSQLVSQLRSRSGVELEEMRDLTPAQQGKVNSVKVRLGNMRKMIDQAESSLTKWASGKKFEPQKEILEEELRKLQSTAKALLSMVQRKL